MKESSRNYVTERDSAYIVFTLLLTKYGSYGLTWSEVYRVSHRVVRADQGAGSIGEVNVAGKAIGQKQLQRTGFSLLRTSS